MLTFRHDWHVFPGGAVALDLLAQVPDRIVRTPFVRCVIRASLELTVATWPNKKNVDLGLKESIELLATWSISRMHYIHASTLDDEVLAACQAVSTDALLIVPSNLRDVFRHALENTMQGRAPTVFTFDEFISWRVLFASLDAGWTHARALIELFNRYNRLAISFDLDTSMIIEIPRDIV